jgi:hypothetical protein
MHWSVSKLRDVGEYWFTELDVGTKKTGKGRRKIGRKKRRMRAKIRHRKK